MRAAVGIDVAAPLLLLSVILSWRRNFSMRGITYRSKVVPLNVERAGKALLYISTLGTVDMVIRRLGELLWFWSLEVPPASARTAACLRLLLLHVPVATWALTGPLSVAGSTRDDRGFSLAATRSRLWTWMSRCLFGGQTKIVLSEEWRDLSEEERDRWMGGRHYVIGMHPHGLLPIGAILNGLTWAGGGLGNTTASGVQLPKPLETGSGLHQCWFPKMRLRAAVASGACGLVPGFYEMFTKLGAFECTKSFMQKVLREDKDVAVFPGGAQESAYAAPGRYVCLIHKHKGFVRLAIEEHRDILPMWCFGDEALVPQSREPHWIIVMLQRISKECVGLLVPPTLAGWLHFPPLTLVAGVPVSLEDLWPKEVGGQVPQAAVDEGHARYIRAIQQLFDRNKAHVPGGHENGSVEFL
mmetsp:Transcript_67945/g.198818  ORF Transcript_67945/g.198818 Transcript_67945/m.198818 type:complete len:413 (-) Transcript_67945:48-1286(-)